jgi:gliding motility-associated-like protein
MTKKLLSGLFLFVAMVLVTNTSKATHVAGAEITYVHVSGNTYDVTLTVYKDAFGTTVLPNQDICFSSSCGTPFTQSAASSSHPNFVYINAVGDTVNLNYGEAVPEQLDCATSSNLNQSGAFFEVYTYGTTVTLPPCADWTMQWDLCCRNGAITNGFANEGFSISSTMNNLIGPNSSPQFLKPGVKRFCEIDITNPNAKPFNWDHPSTESDGDSVNYRFDIPQEPQGFAGCPVTEVDLVYAAGYTQTNPMPTHNGFAIDRKLGFFTFMPSLAGVYVVVITVEEYRFNSTTLAYELVGKVKRDMQIPVDAQCIPSVQGGPRLNINTAGVSTRGLDYDSAASIVAQYRPGLVNDTIILNNDQSGSAQNPTYSIPVVDYNCNNSTVDLTFDIELFCPTIDRTDFMIIGPDGVTRPVEDILTGCTSVLRETRQLRLVLHQTLDLNGEYLLYIKRGNDGNTLENKCGYEIDDNYYMIIKVEDCPELSYEITNVTVVDDEKIKVQYDLDPLSYFANTFNRIDVLRANNDQNFQRIGEITNQAQREYTDTQLDKWAVDNQAYQYIFQMVTNSNPRLPTNFVNSILLTATETDGQLDLEWEEYLNDTYGAPAEYEVFVGDSVTNPGQMTWVSLQNTGITRNYTYTIPENVRVWLKVEGYDPSTVNNLRSESNWVEIGSSTPPPPPIVDPVVTYVPNIITPNNDGINDRFYFSLFPQNPDERPYSNVELSIFNRWGKQVFYDDNYMDRNNEIDGWNGTDQNTGATLADGVYFYVAKFSDVSTGKTEERNGSVTVSASR